MQPVEANPSVKGGEPVISGTRVPVSLVMSKMARGMSFDEVLKNYPKLEAVLLWLGEVATKAVFA